MNKKIQHKESRGLPGGPNEMFIYTTGIFSTEGFRMDSPDVNNYENIIPSGSITMKERDGSPLKKGPIYGVDNLGNEQIMYPGFDYEFPGTQVKETLLAKMGGGLLDKTIKCSSCGWEWKAADGGSDIMSCHKCPGKGVVKAQNGKETKSNEWLGNKLDPNGRITSETKGGNRISFTNNQRTDDWINKTINTGKYSYDPQTGITYKLEKPVKGLSKEDQFMATKTYQDLTLGDGFTNDEQDSKINKLSKEEQEWIDNTNTNNRKKYAAQTTNEFYKNPLVTLPGTFTPEGMMIMAMQGAANLETDLREGDYTSAAVDGLSMLPFLPNPIKQSLRTIPKAKNVKEVIGALSGIPTEASLPRMSAEQLKTYRKVQEIGRMRATGKPLSDQYKYALEQNIPEEHLQQIFRKSKSEIDNLIPFEQGEEAYRLANPIRERLNLQRPARRQSTSDMVIDQMNTDRDAALRQYMSENNSNAEELAQELLRYNDVVESGRYYNPTVFNEGRVLIPRDYQQRNILQSLGDDINRYVDAKIPTSQVIGNKFLKTVSEYPYFNGRVAENVPSLSLNTSGTLKNVSNKVVGQQNLGINSGDVFTGSLNTSHSSYLPQLKQVFKYGDGSPQFLGYKPMNHLGFLSDYHYSADDIAKYLNTEIDDQVRKGVIPKNVLRPYVKDDKYNTILLPHYGIKQFEDGGEDLFEAQKGGRVSIPVTDRNDPRLKAYTDSMNLHTQTMDRAKFLINSGHVSTKINPDKNADDFNIPTSYSVNGIKPLSTVFYKLTAENYKNYENYIKSRNSMGPGQQAYAGMTSTLDPNGQGSGKATGEWTQGLLYFKKPEQSYYLAKDKNSQNQSIQKPLPTQRRPYVSNMQTIPSIGISNIDVNNNLSLKPMSTIDSQYISNDNQYVPNDKIKVYIKRNPDGTESIIDDVDAHLMIKKGTPGVYSRMINNTEKENISNPYDESIAENYQTGGSTGEEDLMTEYAKRINKNVRQFGDKLRPASFLNKAADMAEAKGFGFGEDNGGPLDAVRHASAATSVASNLPVPSFMNNILPGSEQAIREYGSRALGALYEIANYNSEGREMDFYNNKIGAQIGSIPGLTDEQRLNLINNALVNKQLQIDNIKRIKPKQEGGEQEDTPWTAYLNPANWGTSRYDDAGTFKKAFRAARVEGDSDFLYKGNRYSTELKPTAAPMKGITPELLIRQAYRESTFNPNAVSPTGFKGLGQIGKAIIKDYKKANNITGEIDPFNMKQNTDVQKYSMNELYNSSFINKPGQSEEVRLAKTLASYNLGRTKVANLLNDLKEDGVDIYNSLDWINKLPSESKDYINDILLQKNTTFNTDFSKALGNQKNIPIKRLYGFRDGGESKPGPLMKAYNRLSMEKKMGGAIVNKKQFGGQLNSVNITMYKDYIKGNIENETEAVKNYDKLNRIYYSKAKELGMSAANYIMTYVVGNS